MTKKTLNRIDKLLDRLKFNRDGKLIMEECLILASKRSVKIDPFNFDLKHMLLVPLEESLAFEYPQMRKIIEANIKDGWGIDSVKIEYGNLEFKNRPTCKALISCLIYKIQHKQI